MVDFGLKGVIIAVGSQYRGVCGCFRDPLPLSMSKIAVFIIMASIDKTGALGALCCQCRHGRAVPVGILADP